MKNSEIRVSSFLVFQNLRDSRFEFFVLKKSRGHPCLDETTNGDQDFAINSETLDEDDSLGDEINGNITETCLQLENGTERCTSNDESKPHLTLNSHIISATLRPPNNDFFHVRSVNITMKEMRSYILSNENDLKDT